MIPEKIEGAAVPTKANVYFGGKVVSHSLVFSNGTKQTLGLIYPGTYNFSTGGPERMDIVAGSARYRLAGSNEWIGVVAGSGFEVAGNSSFDIEVDSLSEYLCSYL